MRPRPTYPRLIQVHIIIFSLLFTLMYFDEPFQSELGLILEVPRDFETVREALDFAGPGDTIIVREQSKSVDPIYVGRYRIAMVCGEQLPIDITDQKHSVDITIKGVVEFRGCLDPDHISAENQLASLIPVYDQIPPVIILLAYHKY